MTDEEPSNLEKARLEEIGDIIYEVMYWSSDLTINMKVKRFNEDSRLTYALELTKDDRVIIPWNDLSKIRERLLEIHIRLESIASLDNKTLGLGLSETSDDK